MPSFLLRCRTRDFRNLPRMRFLSGAPPIRAAWVLAFSPSTGFHNHFLFFHQSKSFHEGIPGSGNAHHQPAFEIRGVIWPGTERTHPDNVLYRIERFGTRRSFDERHCVHFLARQLDEVAFFSADNEGDGAEGFSVEFGSRGQIRSFSLAWPNLERNQSRSTASPQQIINCIRAQKTIVLPNACEETYFQRIKALANAKTFTITKITPYYSKSIFSRMPAQTTCHPNL